MLYGFGLNESGQFGEYKDGTFTQHQEKFKEFISGEVEWKNSDYIRLASIAKGSTASSFFSESASIAAKKTN